MSSAIAFSTAARLDARAEDSARIFSALQRYWGYDSFRPRQEEIVRAISEGRDVCVIMPTGGGKSLCYQLPAALAGGQTAVVISPLIALMQDQVAQLTQMGIPAVFLNSAVAEADRSDVKHRVAAGEYRLLYLSPERAVLDGTAEWLKRVPISFFAIDEAHCISEWGHDFRPEYRQLSRLRQMFPDKPIAAFTASATQRVRHDIIEQLRLRDPFKHIASFHRANLRYIVKQTDAATQKEMLLRIVRRAGEGNLIVYAPTIARVEETADMLEESGIPAIAYHGQMDTRTRRKNQEKWMNDEVRVMVATLAFGLGINKASVRAVVHLALPKSVEHFYQESGRAGRDGLPADCFLLWQFKDTHLFRYFNSKISDPEEKQRAELRCKEIETFAKFLKCRQRTICQHFGETPLWAGCDKCDVCAGVPKWLEVESQARSNRSNKRSRRDSSLRFVPPAHSSHPSRRSRAIAKKSAAYGGDHELRKFMQEWRRDMAKELEIPAFIVMHDSALDDLCLVEPQTLSELQKVSGFGQKKVEAYGDQILDALRRFRQGARASTDWHAKVSRPAEETLRLLQEGRTFEEIAETRGRRVQAVVALIAEMVECGEAKFQLNWFSAEKYEEIAAACRQFGTEKLKPLKEALPPETTYEEIKLIAAHLRGQAQAAR